jgi:serine/threonine protein kinase
MIGKTIRHYRVLGKLGVGGMGIVYEAEDVRLPRRVALKFLPDDQAEDPDAARRFQREAETIALLNHPHICTIYDIDEHEAQVHRDGRSRYEPEVVYGEDA